MVKDEKITTHPNEGMKSNKYNKKKEKQKKQQLKLYESYYFYIVVILLSTSWQQNDICRRRQKCRKPKCEAKAMHCKNTHREIERKRNRKQKELFKSNHDKLKWNENNIKIKYKTPFGVGERVCGRWRFWEIKLPDKGAGMRTAIRRRAGYVGTTQISCWWGLLKRQQTLTHSVARSFTRSLMEFNIHQKIFNHNGNVAGKLIKKILRFEKCQLV